VQRTEQNERALTEALRGLAADEAGLGCSSAVEARLLTEVRSIATARRRLAYVAVVVTAAAVWLLVVARPTRLVPPETRAREVTTEFLPLTYSDLPATGGQVVRLEVARGALAAFGLMSAEASAGSLSETILADVFVGEDGLARAVRFVRPLPDREPTQ
jgi:hypothetical protein